MRRFTLLIFLCLGGFFGYTYLTPQKNSSADQKFSPTFFPFAHRSFVIIVTGHNNGATLEKTLHSIFSQIYDDFRVIYIDDASTDGSFEFAQELINKSGQEPRVHLIRNEQRLGEFASFKEAGQLCSDDAILVMVKEGEYLAHEWVLNRLNQYYVDPDLWKATSQFCEFPSYQLSKNLSLETAVAKLFKEEREEESHEYVIPEILSLVQSKKIVQNQLIADQKRFAIVLYTHNAVHFCERMLRSVFDQNYDAYRIFFIDDGSADGTFETAQRICLEQGHQDRMIMMRNEEPLGFSTCLLRAIDHCTDQEIVIPLEGWFSHENVLSQLNWSYRNPDLWMVSGKNLEYPLYQDSESRFHSFYAGTVRSLQDYDEKSLTKLVKGHTDQLQGPAAFHLNLWRKNFE